ILKDAVRLREQGEPTYITIVHRDLKNSTARRRVLKHELPVFVLLYAELAVIAEDFRHVNQVKLNVINDRGTEAALSTSERNVVRFLRLHVPVFKNGLTVTKGRLRRTKGNYPVFRAGKVPDILHFLRIKTPLKVGVVEATVRIRVIPVVLIREVVNNLVLPFNLKASASAAPQSV